MRRIFGIIVFIMVSKTLSAQYYDDAPQLSFGIDAAFPLNKEAKVYQGMGLGGTAKLALPLGEYTDVVFSGTLMSFAGEKYVKNSRNYKAPRRNIAVGMIGYRYYLSPLYNYNTFYIEPRVGLTLDGTKHQAFTFGAALGYLINNKIDLSAKYQSFGGGLRTLSFVSLGVAYGFSLN